MYIPVVGASGAVYGLLAATAMLFPNNVIYLYGAIPLKMKWLALGLAGISLFSGFSNNPGDSVAHFAHLGGMLFGFIIVKIWNKNRTNFY
jgi:membrane associated rhomboid family serine protease